jgi:hypothetical protein
VLSHLRCRWRQRGEAQCHATKKNEFFQFITFFLSKDSNPRDSKVATLEKIKGNDPVTFPLRQPTEIARVLVRLDHVASFILNADHEPNAGTCHRFLLVFSPTPEANDLFQ